MVNLSKPKSFKQIPHEIYKISLVVLCIIFFNPAIAQEAERSQLEKFSGTRGGILVREQFSAGNELDFSHSDGANLARVKMTAIVVYSPGREAQRVKGLRLEVRWLKDGRYERKGAATLDVDEIDSAIAAIDYLIKATNEWRDKKFEANSISYSTKESFVIGYYQGETSNYFMRIGGAEITMYPLGSALPKIRATLEQGKNILSKK